MGIENNEWHQRQRLIMFVLDKVGKPLTPETIGLLIEEWRAKEKERKIRQKNVFK